LIIGLRFTLLNNTKMTLSSLEQDLQEFKEQQIEELHQYNSQLIEELEQEFEAKKQEYTDKSSKQLQDSKEEYKTYHINLANKEAKQILLKAKQDKTNELSKTIFEELKPQFVSISTTIISKASTLLQCKEKDLTISINKLHQKEFEKVISKSQIQATSIPQYTIEISNDAELVRFNLGEFVQEKVQESINNSINSGVNN